MTACLGDCCATTEAVGCDFGPVDKVASWLAKAYKVNLESLPIPYPVLILSACQMLNPKRLRGIRPHGVRNVPKALRMDT